MPTYRTHRARNAVFRALGDIAVVEHYGDVNAEAAAVPELAFADLCALPRCGFKNVGAPDWLQRQGVTIPDRANKATRQLDGSICARLGGTDILLCADPLGESRRPTELLRAWAADSSKPKGWDAHREDGYSWFLLTGRHSPELFTRICAVDLRLQSFHELEVAQTQALGVSGVIIRADLAAIPAYHLFFDIASADFLIESMEDVMAEFQGRLVGLGALKIAESL